MVFNSLLGKQRICRVMLNHTAAKLEVPPNLKSVAQRYGYIFIKLFGYPLDYVWRLRARTVLSHLPPKGKVLDVGCSFGVFAFELARRGYDVTGVDVNPESIALADNIKEALALRNVRFVCANFLNHEFPAEEFDVAIIVEVLEHIKDDRLAIQKLHRVLKKDGVMIASVPYTSEVKEFVEPAPSFITHEKERVATGSPGEFHFRSGYNSDRLASLLEGEGFAVTQHTYTKAPRILSRSMILFPLVYVLALAFSDWTKNSMKLTVVAKRL